MSADEIELSQLEMPDVLGQVSSTNKAASKSTKSKKQTNGYEPPNLGKAVRLPVPDFSDPNRPKTCLEVNFPIVPINALSNLEGNAGKPIYQMSKWWARRRSSVFRSLLIAAAVQAPDDPLQAEKLVWEHYYCNHQKAGHFKNLRVLDCFMGGGTTLVEGARLGFQMTGVDLNPVAWFVVKNELACSDPEQVRAFFDHIEREVKPLVQPFYTTTCPRGHKGHWVDTATGKVVEVEPLDLSPEQRQPYHWEGPEVIYTFWAKHGPCQASGCGHRTPIFKNPVIAEKKLTAYYIPISCPGCRHKFNAELGETRMAPGTERVVLDNEPSFTELSQPFAQLLSEYSKGNGNEKCARIAKLIGMVEHEPGLVCPKCSAFAGQKIKSTLEIHLTRSTRVADLKKKDFGIESRHIYMYLLIKPEWLKGNAGMLDDKLLGGYAGAEAQSTVRWYEERLKNVELVEVRGRIKLAEEEAAALEEEESVAETEELLEEEGDTSDRKKYGLPREIVLKDGTRIQTRQGTVSAQSEFRCQACGRAWDIAAAERGAAHHSPVTPYALQCHCHQCEAEGYSYGGRYFKAPDVFDSSRLVQAEKEWAERCHGDLEEWWPKSVLPFAMETHLQKGNLTTRGYTHWWKMFNPRQLLVHTQLLRAITNSSDESWPLNVREQALGAFQQYLQNQNMFSHYDVTRDTSTVMFANNNFHPKITCVENNLWGAIGRGNWKACCRAVVEGLLWTKNPWERLTVEGNKGSVTAELQDSLIPRQMIYCESSTDLSALDNNEFDLIITDPPFGNNLFYADLADFFYVWLRIPLLRWYQGLPEQAYFEPEFTPKALEAIKNPAEHPDDREDWEKERKIRQTLLEDIQSYANDATLKVGDPNPLYRPEPAEDFYQQTLSACWTEAGRLLRPGGVMAFTFHHNEDEAWVNVLEALFDAGYVLVATYPLRSDETKGSAANAAFGSKKIEYDIIHICRKRLEDLQPVSWARMRRWVKEEVGRLKELLEHSHGKFLPEADLRVIMRGKALEFYSRHYGQVYTGEGEILSVREALLGINLIIDDLAEETSQVRPPETAEPATRLFLRIFTDRNSIPRDELHKTLRGTGVSQGDLEDRGWIRATGTTIHIVPIEERFQHFTTPGRNRKVIKTDLDQAYFLIGAAMKGSGINIDDELNRKTFSLKKSTDALLQWYAERESKQDIKDAARLSLSLVSNWRTARSKQVENLNKQLELTLWETIELEEMIYA